MKKKLISFFPRDSFYTRDSRMGVRVGRGHLGSRVALGVKLLCFSEQSEVQAR